MPVREVEVKLRFGPPAAVMDPYLDCVAVVAADGQVLESVLVIMRV